MNMNQIAIAYGDEYKRDNIKAMLGLTDAPWVKDTVISEVSVRNNFKDDYEVGENIAELEFCMAMGGTQFELIRYVQGPNWIAEAEAAKHNFPFIAHIGFHLDDDEPFPKMEDAVLVQEAWTQKHTNAELNAAGRRYHYQIWQQGEVFYKFIRRLTVPKNEIAIPKAEAMPEMGKPRPPTAQPPAFAAPDAILMNMARTYRDRNAVYGDNFLRLGQTMHAMFPQGLTLQGPDDWIRLYFLFLQQVKLSRYATNFKSGGHKDSVHDAAVYGALLESYDERIADRKMGAGDGNEARNAANGAAADGRKTAAD